jgi:hypothetical protein
MQVIEGRLTTEKKESTYVVREEIDILYRSRRLRLRPAEGIFIDE